MAIVVLVGGVGFALKLENEKTQEAQTEVDSMNQTEPAMDTADDTKEQPATSAPSSSSPDTPVSNEAAKAGRYTSYSKSSLSAGYETNVVFFYAPWCPECRAFKQAIQSASIPDGVQFLEADFDSSTDLKKQYGVTLQSTFVKVDDNDTQQSKWVGYGKEKSTQTILNNL